MIDIIGKNAKGELAAMLSSGIQVWSMRPYLKPDGNSYITTYTGGDMSKITNFVETPISVNATLLKDEWKQLDKAVIDVSRSRLGGIQDLRDNNLIYNLGNGFATTLLETQKASDSLTATVSMNAKSRGENDRLDFSLDTLPIPIVHSDYEINGRLLEADRRNGNPIDVTLSTTAARKVNEEVEKMLFTNSTYQFGGANIYSYLTFPDRRAVTLSLNWDDASKTPQQILADVQQMKAESIVAKHFGQWMLYVPTAYETVLDNDYSSSYSGVTIRDRILKIAGIKGIKTIDLLPANNVILVQMTSDVVRLVEGMPITNVAWKSEGNFVSNYKVLTIQVPQLRSDYNGNTGIVQLA